LEQVTGGLGGIVGDSLPDVTGDAIPSLPVSPF
jgi:hypothetical protein